jgi:hypothetical protein
MGATGVRVGGGDTAEGGSRTAGLWSAPLAGHPPDGDARMARMDCQTEARLEARARIIRALAHRARLFIVDGFRSRIEPSRARPLTTWRHLVK